MRTFNRIVALSALTLISVPLAGCDDGYTTEVIANCSPIVGKTDRIESEISGAELFWHGEIRERTVTNYYIVTEEHGEVEVDFEYYTLNDVGDPYCTDETVRTPTAAEN